jgi:hypothetical protein
MKLADLSSFTRVVIVDNDEDDGLGIRSALDVNHIPSLFIHAEGRGALPKEPFPNVRLVFLDLNMIPVAASNERAIATYCQAPTSCNTLSLLRSGSCVRLAA